MTTTKLNDKYKIYSWFAVLAYMALIWFMSSLSHPPSTSSFPFKDKGVHCVEYGVLAFLTCFAFRSSGVRSMTKLTAFTFFLSVGWAILDEIHQAFVPNRSSDVMDVVADSFGVALAVLFFYFLRKHPKYGNYLTI